MVGVRLADPYHIPTRGRMEDSTMETEGDVCPQCQGSGSLYHNGLGGWTVCPYCGGSGEYRSKEDWEDELWDEADRAHDRQIDRDMGLL